ncbi:3D domain-containing protein [Clostridium swellfunianum]|uniref:3D domain-containing protein n=1 Tax=Clostridium swellfunianum TaxID=1367462 RepID=UPI00202F3A96|nr:3D domain-containing protein [Clostridium swellfunianum]MCM0649474.1 3D domain-containing protein [Clostridium swellfunianum]
MDKLKKAFERYFSIGPKAAFIVVLILIGSTVGVNAAKKTIVVAIDGKETKIVTFRKTFKNVLEANDIVLGPKDKTMPSIDTVVKKIDRLDIKRAIPVEVAVDGQNIEVLTTEDTVDKMLEEEGIEVRNSDRVLPSRTVPVENGLKVSITRIDERVIKVSESIDFATVVQKDEEALNTVTKVLQNGQQGEKVITTKVLYEDGKEVAREVVNEAVEKEPIKKIVSVGTLAAIKVSRGGSINDVVYRKALRMQATAYTADYASTGKRPGDKGFGITATGTTAKRNPNGYSTIAVDPRVIPLGTKLYVEGYGYAIAEDTGGAIKGNIIDIFLNSNSECIKWGRRYVNVYVLK